MLANEKNNNNIENPIHAEQAFDEDIFSAAPANPAESSALKMAEQINCSNLVERIRNEEPGAQEELYRLFAKGVRFYFFRHVGPDEAEDRFHDTFLTVIHAIREGELRDPERLMGFVRTIMRRKVATTIESNMKTRQAKTPFEYSLLVEDPDACPETRFINHQNREIIRRILEGFNDRDREILTRYYLYEEDSADICRALNLSNTQFRVLKSRAKTRLSEMSSRRLRKLPAKEIIVKQMAAGAH
jgi:RNA polymerase sigma-70 factor, ECF subfamily